MRGIFLLVENQLASQEGLCSVAFVRISCKVYCVISVCSLKQFRSLLFFAAIANLGRVGAGVHGMLWEEAALPM